jgi:hypothetical protein
MSPFINRQKASSHTMPPGGVYVGIVQSVLQNGTVNVFIPRLGINYGPLRIAGQSAINKIQKDQQVICSFLNSGVTEVVVIATLDMNPAVVSGEYITNPDPVNIYTCPYNSEKVMKFSASFSIGLETGPARPVVYKEFVLIFDTQTSPYLSEVQSIGTDLFFSGITLDFAIANNFINITCETGSTLPVSITTTRLFGL